MGKALGCLVWIILFVCMIFVDEPWSETVALVTGIIVAVIFLSGVLSGGRAGGKYGNDGDI